jgi:hypothetical protein
MLAQNDVQKANFQKSCQNSAMHQKLRASAVNTKTLLIEQVTPLKNAIPEDFDPCAPKMYRKMRN